MRRPRGEEGSIDLDEARDASARSASHLDGAAAAVHRLNTDGLAPDQVAERRAIIGW